jgi:CheY-like chemotaxis protein
MELLLVEDDLQSAQLFVNILQTEGYTVTHTDSALEGLRIARQKEFDAIILDINLPDLDGATMGLSLRRSMANVPIIALTASADKLTRDRTKAFGFNAFIAKPCTDDDLISTVNTLIKMRNSSK